MTRKFGSGKLRQGKRAPGGVNPMDGVANLADVMLVFACGLMLALIINWNVDVGGTAQGAKVSVERGQEITDVQTNPGDPDESADEDTQYEEVGVVYKDPATGKLYMVTQEEK